MHWLAESDTDIAAVRALLIAARDVDGRPEIASDGPLPREFRGGRHLLVPGGYAHLDVDGDSFGRQVAEVVVHPEHRRRGVGTALVEAVLAQAASDVRIWAHGDHPGAAAIADRLGLATVRELLRMGADLDAEPAEPVWRDGVRVRTFVPGQDEAAMVAVNRAAFDWHPEQGALTVADVEATEREPWFDPAGFFLAVDSAERVIGFHWTKVHPDKTGEVYVVGVDPQAQGGGLGKALTLAGLRYLRRLGLSKVILYVEADNAPAVAVYRRLGFVRLDADLQYARTVRQ